MSESQDSQKAGLFSYVEPNAVFAYEKIGSRSSTNGSTSTIICLEYGRDQDKVVVEATIQIEQFNEAKQLLDQKTNEGSNLEQIVEYLQDSDIPDGSRIFSNIQYIQRPGH